jgi:hypothetical protein
MKYELILEFREGTTREDALAIMDEIMRMWKRYLVASIKEESDR